MNEAVKFRNVSKYYKVIMTGRKVRGDRSFIDKLKFIFLGSTFSERRSVTVIKALDKVTLNIWREEIFGILGKKGSGKNYFTTYSRYSYFP